MREINEITGEIVDAAYQLHTRLGRGLLESVYEALLAHALTQKGLLVERQKRIRLEFDGMVFTEAFRADLLVQGKVLVELKSVETVTAVMSKQVLTYLKILNLPVGLLINFGAPLLSKGVHRIINPAVAPPRAPLGPQAFDFIQTYSRITQSTRGPENQREPTDSTLVLWCSG